MSQIQNYPAVYPVNALCALVDDQVPMPKRIWREVNSRDWQKLLSGKASITQLEWIEGINRSTKSSPLAINGYLIVDLTLGIYIPKQPQKPT